MHDKKYCNTECCTVIAGQLADADGQMKKADNAWEDIKLPLIKWLRKIDVNCAHSESRPVRCKMMKSMEVGMWALSEA